MKSRRPTLRLGEHAPPSPVFLLFLSLIIALPAENVCAEPAETAATSSTNVRLVRPGDMNTGALLLSAEEGRYAVLLLAILSAVALAWWRYHRRDYASPRRIGRGI